MSNKFQWQVISSDEDFERYINFVLRNYADLQVPYDFFTLLSSVYLPTSDGQVLIYQDIQGEIAGTVSYTWGTSDQDYADKENAEIQIAYLVMEHRVTSAFIQGLKLLAQTAIDDQQHKIHYFKFYVPALHRYRKLFSRFASTEKSSQHLDYYSTDIHFLDHFTSYYYI